MDDAIAIFGATGLVGGECLRLMLADPAFPRVTAFVRRAMPGGHPRLSQRVVDFDNLARSAGELDGVGAIVCALGTTMARAGSRPAFRRVDLDYPREIARLGSERGVRHFLLVSSMGASVRSRFFYSRVKGELEDAVMALPYRAITIARPSLLLGERAEFRPGERLGQMIAPLVPGRWRPVKARDVAAALVAEARAERPGTHILESDEIRRRAAERGA